MAAGCAGEGLAEVFVERPPLVVGAEFPEAACTPGGTAIDLGEGAAIGHVHCREGEDAAVVGGRGLEEVVIVEDDVVVITPGEAEGDADVYIRLVHACEQVLRSRDLRPWVGVHLGEGGVAAGVLVAVVAHVRGEDVGVEINNHAFRLIVPCYAVKQEGALRHVGACL